MVHVRVHTGARDIYSEISETHTDNRSCARTVTSLAAWFSSDVARRPHSLSRPCDFHFRTAYLSILRALNAIIAGRGNSGRKTANRSGRVSKAMTIDRSLRGRREPRSPLPSPPPVLSSRATCYIVANVIRTGRHNLHNYRRAIAKRVRFLNTRNRSVSEGPKW